MKNPIKITKFDFFNKIPKKGSKIQKYKWIKNELIENANKYSKNRSSIKHSTFFEQKYIFFQISNNLTNKQLQQFEKFILKIERENTRELFSKQIKDFDPKQNSSQLGLLLIKKDNNNRLKFEVEKKSNENIVTISIWIF